MNNIIITSIICVSLIIIVCVICYTNYKAENNKILKSINELLSTLHIKTNDIKDTNNRIMNQLNSIYKVLSKNE